MTRPTAVKPATPPRHQGTAQKAKIIEVSEDAGQRIDNYLLRILKDVPKSRVYRMLRKGEVRVNGGRKGPTYRLQTGDRVRIPPHQAGQQPAAPFIGADRIQDLERAILFEDDDLLVVDKPSGVAVHGGSGVSFGVIEALRRVRGAQLELAHRLDRDTSGCLLLAKRRSALRRLHESIREGQLEKSYLLIVQGHWPADLVSVRLPLHKFVTASGERRVRVAGNGKPSRTDFKVLERAGSATLLEADLRTGRTHQIRVHAAASGFPVLGDSKYGSTDVERTENGFEAPRLCLHAQRLVVPWEGKRLSFVSPVPAAMDQTWVRLLGA